jgi:DNA-binding MarR family transcriptional regulator
MTAIEQPTSPEKTDFLTEYNLLRKLERSLLFTMMAKAGLYPGQLPILEFIQAHEGCTQTEIARHLTVSAASIASSTKRMQKAGLILKKTDQYNLRANMLFLTPKGRELAGLCRAEINALQSAYLNGFQESEKEQIIQLLSRINENIRRIKENVASSDSDRQGAA